MCFDLLYFLHICGEKRIPLSNGSTSHIGFLTLSYIVWLMAAGKEGSGLVSNDGALQLHCNI